jgi:hypothetical protein
MRCTVCQREYNTALQQTWIVEYGNTNVCHDCCKWLNRLERKLSFTFDEIRFLCAVAEKHTSEAYKRYIQHRETDGINCENTLHYQEIAKTGASILETLRKG